MVLVFRVVYAVEELFCFARVFIVVVQNVPYILFFFFSFFHVLFFGDNALIFILLPKSCVLSLLLLMEVRQSSADNVSGRLPSQVSAAYGDLT